MTQVVRERSRSIRIALLACAAALTARTLFIAAAEWRGMEAATSEGPGLTGKLLAAAGQAAPLSGRP